MDVEHALAHEHREQVRRSLVEEFSVSEETAETYLEKGLDVYLFGDLPLPIKEEKQSVTIEPQIVVANWENRFEKEYSDYTLGEDLFYYSPEMEQAIEISNITSNVVLTLKEAQELLEDLYQEGFYPSGPPIPKTERVSNLLYRAKKMGLVI